MQFPVLIGDVGGTNARFAIVEDAHAQMEMFDPVLTGDFPDVQHAIDHAVLAKTSIIPKSMVLAVAAPIFGETYQLTNAPWAINPRKTMHDLGMQNAGFMNDFSAQALGALEIDTKSMHRIGGGECHHNATRIVLGPGTSFGVATLVHSSGRWTILPAECACADLGLGTGNNAKRERQIERNLERINNRQTIETMICGPGLENIYQAICKIDATNALPLSAAAIASAYTSDRAAREAVDLFAALLGRVAGNLALGTMAKGGVFVTGGMACKMLPLLEQGAFRAEFENKSPHDALAKSIPTWFMNCEDAALTGLSAYVRTPRRFDMAQACVFFSDT